MNRSVQNYIGGKLTDAQDGRRTQLIDPSTGEVFSSAPLSSVEDVDTAYRTASAAFEEWRETTPAERQRALLGLADAIEARTEELVDAECQNTGKPKSMMRSEELPQIVDHIRFFAGACRLLEGRSAGEYETGFTSYVRREPVGVVGQIAPWNYPLMEAVWKFVPAIAAGNTVVLKPSDTTPVSTAMVAEIAGEYFPSGVFNVICGDRATGQALVRHHAPAMISITGSTRAGSDVAARAAEGLKRVHLELGGNAPVVVLPDADLQAVVEAVASAGYYNAGQDCTAATRILVHEDIAQDFAAAMSDRASKLRVGAPGDEVDYGPLNNDNQLRRVEDMISRAPKHVQVLTGGSRCGTGGYFFEPTVLSGLGQDDELTQNEIFGPVVTIQSFSSESQAIECANGTPYGLAASVWTRDHATALRMARRLDAGTVWINAHTVTIAEMPHGGFKQSGYGKDLSVYGLEDYTRIKHVMHSHA